MRVVIDPDNGYLSTQPKATQDFVERKLLKAQTAGDIRLCFRGEHWAEPTTANRLDLADQLARARAEDFKTVTPWRGI